MGERRLNAARLTNRDGSVEKELSTESKFDSAKGVRSRFGIFPLLWVGTFQRLNFLAESRGGSSGTCEMTEPMLF
jgi:hypothetical protein